MLTTYNYERPRLSGKHAWFPHGPLKVRSKKNHEKRGKSLCKMNSCRFGSVNEGIQQLLQRGLPAFKLGRSPPPRHARNFKTPHRPLLRMPAPFRPMHGRVLQVRAMQSSRVGSCSVPRLRFAQDGGAACGGPGMRPVHRRDRVCGRGWRRRGESFRIQGRWRRSSPLFLKSISTGAAVGQDVPADQALRVDVGRVHLGRARPPAPAPGGLA